MTASEFKAIPLGDLLWFFPPFFAYPFPCSVVRRNEAKGIWINFFGLGQCFFSEAPCGRRFYSWVFKSEAEAYQRREE